jgi:hypothetical protein
MSSKAATIASLVRIAAKTEAEFIATVQQVLEEADGDRAAEFFDRLNIPRSIGLDEGAAPNSPVKKITVSSAGIATYENEREVSNGIQKFLDRHERKIKWHAGHPAIEGTQNVLLLFRCAIAVTDLRLARLELLLKSKDELNPMEWAIARELINRTYLSFRNYLNVMAGEWVDAMMASTPKEDLAKSLGDFYEMVDQTVRSLESARDRLEERRVKMAVLPGDPFPPVRPPNYFGGDLLGKGPWKQFWSSVQNQAHHFRECLG